MLLLCTTRRWIQWLPKNVNELLFYVDVYVEVLVDVHVKIVCSVRLLCMSYSTSPLRDRQIDLESAGCLVRLADHIENC